MTEPESSYYFTITTTTIHQDQNNAVFNDDVNGISNPIKWDFDAWPGSVLFKVYIIDSDVSNHDYLDGIVERLTLTPAKSQSIASATTITIYGLRVKDKTSLSMTYKCYCDDNYYGPTCSAYCIAQNSDTYGHYTCDPSTGAKICRSGWEDVSKDCKTFADDCVGNGCLNGARCVDGIRSYTCACSDGYTGSLCQTNINECASSPCLNGGTCSDFINAFTCSCTIGYVGSRCAQTACSVAPANPCLHGGTCYDDRKCSCIDGYAGSICEMTKCQAVPCVNGGTCSANGTCICPMDFIGTQCELTICSLIDRHCQNGASCINGACICKDQFRGVNCEKESCTSDTCLHGGICSNTNNTVGYECNCPQSFTGPRCQSYVAMQPPYNEPITSSDTDANIFMGDGGMLLIIFIILSIILFIIAVVLTAFLIYRRRGAAVKRVNTSTAPASATISTNGIGNAPSSSSSYSPSADDVTQQSRRSPEDRWKSVENGLKERQWESNKDVESNCNQYETLDRGGYSEAGVYYECVYNDYEYDVGLPDHHE